MKKIIIIILSTSLIFIPTNSIADETKETCLTYNLSSLFYDDYYPGTRWANKEITWSHNSPDIYGKQISRTMTNVEVEWIRQGIKSWDDALDTVSFKEVSNYKTAEINIGLTQLDLQFSGYWNSLWQHNIRHKAYIQINSLDDKITNEDRFVHAVQHEIGNVLGLGDIQRSGDISSVLEDPFEFPFGNKTLSNFDTGLIRQLYGESTCPSTFLSNKKNLENVIQKVKEVVTLPIQPVVIKNTKQQYSIVCTKGNKKITMYRYNKDYPCLRGYTRQ